LLLSPCFLAFFYFLLLFFVIITQGEDPEKERDGGEEGEGKVGRNRGTETETERERERETVQGPGHKTGRKKHGKPASVSALKSSHCQVAATQKKKLLYSGSIKKKLKCN